MITILKLFFNDCAATPVPSAGTVAQGQMSAPTSVRRAKRANSASSALPSAARQHIQCCNPISCKYCSLAGEMESHFDSSAAASVLIHTLLKKLVLFIRNYISQSGRRREN